MKEVQKGSGVSDGYRVAILAALNIADDLHRIQRAQQALQKTTIHSLEKLLELTEDQAAEGK
jgi:cell division protein ZapA (FtsZ GTPase activity inhibitor)